MTSINTTSSQPNSAVEQALTNQQLLPSGQQFSQSINQQLQANAENQNGSLSDGAAEQSSTWFSELFGSSTNQSSEESGVLSSMQNSLLQALQLGIFGGASESNTEAAATTQGTDGVATSPPTELDSGQSEQPSALATFVNAGFGENGLDITDGFDAINILNHIPLVSDIYQNVTSDNNMSTFSGVTGGYLYGGVAGVAYELANLTSEQLTGSSISSNVWDMGKSALSFVDSFMPSAKSFATSINQISQVASN